MNIIDKFSGSGNREVLDSRDSLGRVIERVSGENKPKKDLLKPHLKRKYSLRERRRNQAREKALKESQEAQTVEKKSLVSKGLAMLGLGSVSRYIFSQEVEKDKKSLKFGNKLNQKQKSKISENNFSGSPELKGLTKKEREKKLNEVANDIELLKNTLPPKKSEENSEPIMTRIKSEYRFFIKENKNKKADLELNSMGTIMSKTWNQDKNIFSFLWNMGKNLFKYGAIRKTLGSVNYFRREGYKYKKKITSKVDAVKNTAKKISKAKKDKRDANKNQAALMFLVGSSMKKMKQAIWNMPKNLNKAQKLAYIKRNTGFSREKIKEISRLFNKLPESHKKSVSSKLSKKGIKFSAVKGIYVANIMTRAFNYYWRPKERQHEGFWAEISEAFPLVGTYNSYYRIGTDTGYPKWYQRLSFAGNLGLDVFSGVLIVGSGGLLSVPVLAGRTAIGMGVRTIASGLGKFGLKKMSQKVMKKSASILTDVAKKKVARKPFKISDLKNIPKNIWYGFKDSRMWKMAAGYTVMSVGLSEILGSDTIQNFVIGEAENMAVDEISGAEKNLTPAEQRMVGLFQEDLLTENA